MSDSITTTNSGAGPDRTRVSVTCSRCKAATTVPFHPTPGRPIYCRTCYTKKSAAQGGGSTPRGYGAPARPKMKRKQMLSMRRKSHFVYDAMEALGKREGALDEDQRRTFVEMLFSRGSRQSSEAALDFLEEKLEDETITRPEAQRLERLLEQYSQWR